MITRSQTKKIQEDMYGPYGVFILHYYGGEIKRDNKGKLRITWEKGWSDKWKYDTFMTDIMTSQLEQTLNYHKQVKPTKKDWALVYKED